MRSCDEVRGLDGRAIRKVVASALTLRKEVAMNPNELTMADLIEAAKAAKAVRAERRSEHEHCREPSGPQFAASQHESTPGSSSSTC